MVVENRPVDPGSIQGSHRPISFIRIKHEHARTIFCVKLSINNHIVRLVHKNHIIRTCLMYHAACKVEFQPIKRSYSQLAFFNFLLKKKSNKSNILNPTVFAGGANSRRWGRAGPSRRRLDQPAPGPAGDFFKITGPSPTRPACEIPSPRDVGRAPPASFQSHWSSTRPGP